MILDDDGGLREGGDEEREVARQREEVARQLEAAYWQDVVAVIREETWQVHFGCAVMRYMCTSLLLHSAVRACSILYTWYILRSISYVVCTGGVNFN